MDADEAQAIGARARTIRRRRGLSLDVAAGLAGISKPYLSALERGQRGFNRRGLIDDLSNALGCSVVDLTGQPYAPPDRATADALATLPGPVNVATWGINVAVGARPWPGRSGEPAYRRASDARYVRLSRARRGAVLRLGTWLCASRG
ncbi:MAG: helix-turn-helix domain-containing protein [Actinomycetota bacterium]|nr:helix-turn-helix domain-containing protein [Actinomycetota bacterium]